MNYKKFVHLDSNGNPWGIVAAEQLWANTYALKYNKPEQLLDQAIWQDLFAQAKIAAIEFGAEILNCRIRLEYEPAVFRAALNKIGLNKKDGRIEYQCDIKELPNDAGTPLAWKTALDLNWSPQQTAIFTQEIMKDSLGADPNEKAEDLVQDWFHHEEFTYGPQCVAIGFFNNEPCALVVAQINKETGWSRISYMGVSPNYRRKGLGKWVHRHGFQMMLQQGGKLYYGGTHSDNVAMRKLFESHGCHVYCEMEEWVAYIR